jgi:hypothetical protein
MSEPKATIPGLKKFLRGVPQPSKLKCDETVVKVGSSNNRWAEAEMSIVALNPATIQALDNEGTVLRIFRLRDDEGDDPEKATKSQKESWPDAPEAQMAQIITAACDRASSRHEAAYKMAFTALKEMYEAQTARLEEALARAARSEAMVLRMRQPATKEVFVQDEVDGPTQMLTEVLSAALPQLMANMANGKGAQ